MIDVALIDYAKCHAYARSLCGQHGIPACDADDIGSDAFLLSIRRSWRTGEVENGEAAANRLMYTSVLNVIDRRNTHAAKMIREADAIDERTADDGEPTDDEPADDSRREPAVGGSPQAPAVATDDDWENPLWLRLFDAERKELRRKKKNSAIARQALTVIKTGLKDSRLHLIKSEMKFSGTQFCAILNFLQVRFALCFRALRAWREEK